MKIKQHVLNYIIDENVAKDKSHNYIIHEKNSSHSVETWRTACSHPRLKGTE